MYTLNYISILNLYNSFLTNSLLCISSLSAKQAAHITLHDKLFSRNLIFEDNDETKN